MQTRQLLNRKYISLITGVLLLCMSACTLMARTTHQEGKPVIIHFGQGNTIRYNTNRHVYDVVFAGKQVITGARAAWGGRQPGTSTGVGNLHYSVKKISDAHGKGELHVITLLRDGLRIQQLFYVYAGKPFFFTQLRILGEGVAAHYMSPLIADTVMIAGAGDKRGLAVPFDNDMWVRFDAQPLENAHYTSSEVTALYNNDDYRGLVIGSVEHSVWKSGIDVQYKGNNILSLAAYGGLSDSTITHDKIPHGDVSVHDTLCSSPIMIVGLFSDWRTGMAQYAEANRLTESPVITHWNKATPVGWNSWGVIQDHLTLDKAKGVVDFFHDSCKGFRNEEGTLYIDLDSYWDRLVKGGLGGDVSELAAFVRYCKSKGFHPGIYWGPFADWGKYDRTIEGSQWKYPASWITQKGVPTEIDGARAMDPTYPGTKERIVYHINKFKELGFEMIKIDFLGHGAQESDHFYDPAVKTGMQAYKVGMAFLDSVLDNKMLVYAAISPTMATARYVHMRRIACDAFSAIDNTEYTMNSTGYGWWQGFLYDYVDADHVVFKTEALGVNRARLASALVTGTLITGDEYSAEGPWQVTAQRLLQNKTLLALIKDGRPFQPVEANTGRKGTEVLTKTIQGITYLAVFNYGNTSLHYTITSERLGLKKGGRMEAKELFSGASLTGTGRLAIDIPAADAMIFQITLPHK